MFGNLFFSGIKKEWRMEGGGEVAPILHTTES